MLYIKIVMEKRESEWVIPDFILKCDESNNALSPLTDVVMGNGATLVISDTPDFIVLMY